MALTISKYTAAFYMIWIACVPGSRASKGATRFLFLLAWRGVVFTLNFSTGEATMAYEGEILDRCGSIAFDFQQAFAVVVSGARWNPCGHLILNTRGSSGCYAHVAEVRGYPRYMNEQGYQLYLATNRKREIRRTRVFLKEPDNAYLKLEELLSKQWNWYVLPHNCAAFVEEVLQAGGTKAGLYSNCPTKETFR
jgi:hypothetical protein